MSYKKEIKLESPIFIIALHRTGSTLLKNVLDLNPDLAMATDEMHLFVPFVRTFSTIYKEYNNLNNDDELKEMVHYIFNGEIKGTFWKEYRTLGIKEETVYDKIKDTDRSLKAVISVLLEEYRLLRNKKRVGVKYPLHFSKTKILKEWYPDAKFIFLTRDIRAVCASKLNDEATIRRRKKMGILIHYITLLAFAFDYVFSAIFYKRNKDLFYKINYESLVVEPTEELKKLCEYCNIPFEEEMLNAIGKPSSLTGKVSQGFDKERIFSWKKKLSGFDRRLIELITYFSRKQLDDGLSINS